MIKIENVNKYFNRHKKNEIHVINNTSLNFKESGLVALLGPSGCGKTTLLNTIGGLDKINSGAIYINGMRITKRSSSKIDKIRNINIGYIFQDYNLIDNMTVFDNVAITLKMIGIKDKIEIKKRVEYILEKVNMYRYRNRLSGMLSGGERQRVGIARALVKNPSIIIADEPTGNLDSKNTLEIMNIIKAISKTKLVILVTHEKEIAHFYASRIIELKDGVITNDYNNDHSNNLDYRLDNKIYLKDLKSHEKIEQNKVKINFYQNNNDLLDLDIVIQNGNIYIKSNSDEKIEVIDGNSNIELIDDSYKAITKSEYEKYEFDLEHLIDKNHKPKYTSIYNIFNLIGNGFKKLLNYSFLKKLLLLGFMVSGMFILYSISNIYGILDVEDKEFVTQNKNYLMIVNNNVTVENYLKYEQETINYLLPGDSLISMSTQYNDYYQTSNTSEILSGSLASIKMVSSEGLLYGRMPDNEYEIIVDKLTIDNFFEKTTPKMAGIFNYENMLNREFKMDNIPNFKIVGISDLNSPSIYMDEKLFINVIANSGSYQKPGIWYEESKIQEEDANSLLDYTLKQNQITLKKGRYPLNDYEVMVNYSEAMMMPLNKTINLKVNGHKLKVVGYYISDNTNSYLVNETMIKYDLISKRGNIIVYGKDKRETLKTYQELGLNIEDTYEKNKSEYLESNAEKTTVTLIIASIILTISFVEIFLMIRSSFLSRVKEVGVLRAIGVKKSDVYKMFLGEIIAITTLGSLVGYIFMIYVIDQLRSISYFASDYLLNLPVLIIGIILIYGFNIIVGLLPVYHTIKKTPAQILSRNDVD